jgi:hypothetical protein
MARKKINLKVRAESPRISMDYRPASDDRRPPFSGKATPDNATECASFSGSFRGFVILPLSVAG